MTASVLSDSIRDKADRALLMHLVFNALIDGSDILKLLDENSVMKHN